MKSQDIEPIWETVSQVYERYLDPPKSLTFDEMLMEEDRLFLWTMGVENGATR